MIMCCRKLPLLLGSLTTLVALAGCGQTLLFAERSGVNLSVRADTASSPPLEVNFGLVRTVATVVPPAAEAAGRPQGQAVAMVSGFRVERYGETKDLRGAQVDLRIATQFASGDAAVAVAQSPSTVAAIVNTGTENIALPTPPTLETRVDDLSRRVARIGDAESQTAIRDLNLSVPTPNSLAQRRQVLRQELRGVRLRTTSDFDRFERVIRANTGG